MKLIILLIVFFQFSICSFASDKKDKLIYQVLERIGVLEFSNNIKKIKKYNSIAEIDELDYQLKWYYENLKSWYFFDEVDYEKGLIKKLDKNFKFSELEDIHKMLLNPFVVKMLSTLVTKRDIFRFHHRSILTDSGVATSAAKRYAIIKNLYLLHGMSIQKEVMEKRQNEYVSSGRTIVGIVNRKNGEKLFINPLKLKKRLAESEKYFINYLGEELIGYRHFELKEYLRKMKKSIVGQKFIQLYTNYHFLYMTKYLEKIEQDKLDALKVVKPIKD